MTPGYTYTTDITLPVEEFARKAASHYGKYQEFKPEGPTVEDDVYTLYQDHLEFVGEAVPETKPDSYWKELVRVETLKLQGAYKLEKEDTKHRMGDLLAACLVIYEAKQGSGKGDTFYKWLDSIPEFERVVMIREKLIQMGATKKSDVNPDANLKPSMVKAFLYGVKYLDKLGRKNFLVTITGGKLMQNDLAFDTKSLRTVFSGPGYAIWVQSPNDKFYAGNHMKGEFHHSSFLAGKAVKCGGELVCTGGKLRLISAKSGHYQPGRDHFANALRVLGQQGVDLSHVQTVVWKAGKVNLIPATDFLRNPGNWETWGQGKPAFVP